MRKIVVLNSIAEGQELFFENPCELGARFTGGQTEDAVSIGKCLVDESTRLMANRKQHTDDFVGHAPHHGGLEGGLVVLGVDGAVLPRIQWFMKGHRVCLLNILDEVRLCVKEGGPVGRQHARKGNLFLGVAATDAAGHSRVRLNLHLWFYLHWVVLSARDAEDADFIQQISALSGIIINDCRAKRDANVPFGVLHPWICRIQCQRDGAEDLILIQHTTLCSAQTPFFLDGHFGSLVEVKSSLRRFDWTEGGVCLSDYSILAQDIRVP
ncbi:hypothetical protein C8J57DRAFT_1224174 [Mycena rebaudengoi]|nr:hypothetical protein C8J57DRAFT_1224174 [Mycena rebaudengoi]